MTARVVHTLPAISTPNTAYENPARTVSRLLAMMPYAAARPSASHTGPAAASAGQTMATMIAKRGAILTCTCTFSLGEE